MSAVLLSGIMSCSNPAATESEGKSVDTSMEDAMLQQALKRTDVATTLVMANTILEKDSSRTGLYDTLFQVYYEMQNPAGLADVGEVLLKTQPNNIEYLEPTIAGLISLQDYQKALMLQDRMFSITGDLRIKMQMATVHFEMQDFKSAYEEVMFVIDHKTVADTIKVEQMMPSVPNKTQMVSLTALAYFSLGQLEYSEGKKQAAIKHIQKALALEPRYDLAASTLLEIH